MQEQLPTVNVQEAFNPELRQANHELNDVYLQNRPYQDESGNIHDPSTDKVVKPNDYFDDQRKIAEEVNQDTYEATTMPDLARKLAEAEYHEDKTSAQNVSDVLVGKMADFEAKTASTNTKRDAYHNANQSDNLWNRVMSVKDKEIERLKAENATQAKEYVPDWTSPTLDKDYTPSWGEKDSVGQGGKPEENNPGPTKPEMAWHKVEATTQKIEAQKGKKAEDDQPPTSNGFTPKQSFRSWNKQDRAERKKLMRPGKTGMLGKLATGALVWVDYFTSTYSHSPNLSGRYKGTTEASNGSHESGNVPPKPGPNATPAGVPGNGGASNPTEKHPTQVQVRNAERTGGSATATSDNLPPDLREQPDQPAVDTSDEDEESA